MVVFYNNLNLSGLKTVNEPGDRAMALTALCVCMHMFVVVIDLSLPSIAVAINPSLKLDPATGLSTTSSTLQYAATKDDVNAVFACIATHESTNQETDLEPFPIHCEQATCVLLSLRLSCQVVAGLTYECQKCKMHPDRLPHKLLTHQIHHDSRKELGYLSFFLRFSVLD